MILSMTLHLVLSTRVLLFHSCNMSANSNPLLHFHSSKILLCQLLNILQLNAGGQHLDCTVATLGEEELLNGIKCRSMICSL